MIPCSSLSLRMSSCVDGFPALVLWCAIWTSEKPSFFAFLSSMFGRLLPSSTMILRCSRNHGSMAVASNISSTVQPLLNAVFSQNMRSAFGTCSLRSMRSRLGFW